KHSYQKRRRNSSETSEEKIERLIRKHGTSKKVAYKIIQTPCKYFNLGSGCQRGDECFYKHQKVSYGSFLSSDMKEVMMQRRGKPCTNQLTKPDLSKTKGCWPYLLSGDCPKGNNCNYMHKEFPCYVLY